jgi:microcystin-dependent protein
MANTSTLQLPYPVSTDSANVPRDIKALADAIDPLGVAPVGAILMWPAISAPPDVDAAGRALWLLCIGQLVPAATYPKLAAILGQASGNVPIPDYRDMFPVGAGPTMALGSTGGASTVGLTLAQLPAHDHGGKTALADRILAHSHDLNTAGQGVAPGSTGGYNSLMSPNSGVSVGLTNAAAAPDHQHVISAAGGGGTHENRPPYRAINFIMRAG